MSNDFRVQPVSPIYPMNNNKQQKPFNKEKKKKDESFDNSFEELLKRELDKDKK